MARNQVQFEKGVSETRFAEIYGTEEQCHAALVKWRWPNGFECPGCNGAAHCLVTRGARRSFQCNACRKQTSVKAGTIFASSKLPLSKTIYLVTQSKKGISSIELGRRLGVTHTAAWMMKHKLAQVMLARNASKHLKGNVQMDDAYIGGARSGRRGRGATGKTPVVAAVATTDNGKPDQIILRPVKAFSSFAIRKLASTALKPGANIVSNGLARFAAVTQAGCTHTSIKTVAQVLLRPRKASGQSRPASLRVPPLIFRLVTWQRMWFSEPLVLSGISGLSRTLSNSLLLAHRRVSNRSRVTNPVFWPKMRSNRADKVALRAGEGWRRQALRLR